MSQDQIQPASQPDSVAVPVHAIEDTEMTEAAETGADIPDGPHVEAQQPVQATQHSEMMPEVAAPSTIGDTPGTLRDENEALEESYKAETKADAQPADEKLATQATEAQATSMPTTIAEPASDAPQPSSATATEATASGTSAANPVLAKVQSRPASRATSAAPPGGVDHSTSKATGAPARIYLKEQVNDWLLEGMRWIAHTRPQNGLASLGQYLTSADQWRNDTINQGKDASSFHKYWLASQSWKEKNEGKTEADFQAASRA